MRNIRNFCIIAHIDHGKSTLADRFLEITGTVDKRKMKTQYLDQMDLERERGITIKMAPVRMFWRPPLMNADVISDNQLRHQRESVILNLIDTPGHSDFSYEVSRALAAVEGVILLVDVTQGIQAQTLANFRAAKNAGLTIIGAVNKVDLDPSRVPAIRSEVAELLGYAPSDVYCVSGKTGEGAEQLLEAVIKCIPPPQDPRVDPRMNLDLRESAARAVVFDSFYDDHKGIVASVRVFNGCFKAGEDVFLIATHTSFRIKELGVFGPGMKPCDQIGEGEIGYIATGIKNPEKITIGDTVIQNSKFIIQNLQSIALPGYKKPKPVVFVSFYPDDAEYDLLKTSLSKLQLNDSSLTIEPDQNEVLGRGFKVGFLGKLHFEIIAERLKREFDVSATTTFPSVAYRVKTSRGWETIVKPEDLPSDALQILEPMVKIEIIMPGERLTAFFGIQQQFRFQNLYTETVGSQVVIHAEMPLAELMSDFDDQLKSATEGYASFSYELGEYQESDIVKVEILVSNEAIAGVSRFFHRSEYEREARKMVERLKKLLPREQWSQPIQARALGRIIAREDIPALKKDVTGYLYGGDRTRKMKLWKKQKRGKAKLKARAEVRIPPEVFRELLKK